MVGVNGKGHHLVTRNQEPGLHFSPGLPPLPGGVRVQAWKPGSKRLLLGRQPHVAQQHNRSELNQDWRNAPAPVSEEKFHSYGLVTWWHEFGFPRTVDSVLN